MGRKTSPRQIMIALDKVVGMDMQNFFYMLSTGRYINDYFIVRAMNTGTIGEAVRVVADHGRFDARTFKNMSVAQTTKLGYITPTAIKQAKRIKRCADTKTRMK